MAYESVRGLFCLKMLQVVKTDLPLLGFFKALVFFPGNAYKVFFFFSV